MAQPEEKSQIAFGMNRRIGRGINLGNALEADKEGDWGVRLEEEYFRLIREKGFQSVRVPIRWSAHAAKQAPYTIDEAFFQRIDWVVQQALKNDLIVILNIHHYGEFVADPTGHLARYLAIWEQIAARYKDAPEEVIFELLNEPNGDAMTAETWNRLAAEGLEKVRETNPDRFVMIGPVNWNSLSALESLSLPENDRRLIATFHYYSPFNFTHQGAEWASGSDEWLGTNWEGSRAEQDAIRAEFDAAAKWSREKGRPIYLGEFGAYWKADMPSRARWTAFIAREAEVRGFSWGYWEFCAGFGIYDPQKRIFHTPLVDALIPVD